jgi:hypothetical protein
MHAGYIDKFIRCAAAPRYHRDFISRKDMNFWHTDCVPPVSKTKIKETMKKILLCVSLLSMFAAGFIGCSQSRQWNHEQRKAMREALRSYRQMVYLDDLTDAEFVIFTDQVAGELEGNYPVYTTFVEMPGVTDTVDMVVVTTIVDELNADARNMRHIFPYNYLVAQGVLPAGLDHEQQKAFYNCFAGKVNATYNTMSQFFNAILADTTDMSQLRQLEGQCANDLFDWVITEVDVIESVN